MSGRNVPKKNNDMTYHYAGKVHVRGLLRRVWRPRYLALGDDGYLRYHESIPPLIQQGCRQPATPYSNSMYNVPHTHRPKTILAILDGARTIDPYSMVDQHVGLPQGVYGFVFRGRPVELCPSEGSGYSSGRDGREDRDAVVVSHYGEQNKSKDSKKAAVVNLVFPKDSQRRRTAQKYAKAAINPDICGFGGIGGSRNSSSSSLGGYEHSEEEGHNHDGLGNAAINPSVHSGSATKSKQHSVHVQASTLQSREYLCAVSTAAEAESWVVALRWAAERRRMKSYKSGSVGTVNRKKSSASDNAGNIKQEIMNNNENIDEIESKLEDEATSELSSSIEDVSHIMQDHGCVEKQSGNDDSKESLSTLVSDEDSWCKAEKEKKAPSEVDSPWETSQHESKVASIDNAATVVLVKPEEITTSYATSKSMIVDTMSGSKSCSLPTLSKTTTAESCESGQSVMTERKQKVSTTAGKDFISSAKGNRGATIAITKVNKFQLSRGSLLEDSKWHGALPSMPLPGDELELMYEIKVLFLRNCVESSMVSDRNQHSSAEERTIYKTADDVLDLIDGLLLEFNKSPYYGTDNYDEGSDRSTPQRKGSSSKPNVICLLEDARSDVLTSCEIAQEGQGVSIGTAQSKNESTDNKGTFNQIISSIEAAHKSRNRIDSILKSLSKESIICSSRLFHNFLGLHDTNRNNTMTKPILINGDIDDYVRKWLSRIHAPTTTDRVRLAVAVAVRHKFGGPFISLLVLWSFLRCLGIVWYMVIGSPLTVSIPLETYATIIGVSFYCGHGTKQSITHRKSRLHLLLSQPSTPSPTAKKKQSSSNNFFHDRTMVLDSSTDGVVSFDDDHSTIVGEDSESEEDDDVSIGRMEEPVVESSILTSPLPVFPENGGISCWSKPDHKIFMVRSITYLENRVKAPSAIAPFPCRGVDVWITDNAERNISRHPSVLGGKLAQEVGSGTFIVNFLLPFGNLVAYFTVPPEDVMPPNIATVWKKFVRGDQQYRDGKLKLLPVVVDGPWIVRRAVGPGTSPAMLGKDLPLQYYFHEPTETKKGIYEVDVLISASRIARGILNVVKGHTKSLTIAFAFIIEAAEQAELPETVLCAFQVHSLHLEDCPQLPECDLGD